MWYDFTFDSCWGESGSSQIHKAHMCFSSAWNIPSTWLICTCSTCLVWYICQLFVWAVFLHWDQGLCNVQGSTLELSLFIKPEWVSTDQVRQQIYFLNPPSAGPLFYLSLMMTDLCIFAFQLCSCNVLHVWSLRSGGPFSGSPPNKGTSFAWAPEQALVIDLNQD